MEPTKVDLIRNRFYKPGSIIPSEIFNENTNLFSYMFEYLKVCKPEGMNFPMPMKIFMRSVMD